MDHEGGLPGFSHGYSTEDGVVTDELITAEWLGLSTDVSVVAYRLNKNFIGWQTPVGGVSSLSLDHRPTDYLAVVFDASGRELDRFGVELERLTDYPGAETPDVSPPESDWAPLASTGSEIQSEEIPSQELREAISPQSGDRLFLVTVGLGEIVVVVRNGEPHAFAESCAVLDGANLSPGWDGTCLD